MSIITTGAAVPQGQPIPNRVEIRQLIRDRDVWNLYVLGLQAFQAADQQDPRSWYQIAGIHGRPYTPYDDVGSEGGFGGYCTHSSILFPTWHRPYLALYEQVLHQHVTNIANAYPDQARKTRYLAAAAKFRIPYWDWAADSTLPPEIASQREVQVDAPDGVKRIPNPLYSYKFHPMYQDFGDGRRDERQWEAWDDTVRYPTSSTSDESQPRQLNAALTNNRLTLRDRTYNLITQARDYAGFSNDGWLGRGQDPRTYDSLESVHGQIHVLTGNGGHMGVVDYAAFDPVFWLHHTNVDRIFAIWQVLNPNQFVTPQVNPAGTFTIRAGTTENVNTPLHPFRRTANEFWTSTGARDTRTFGYTYPELERWRDRQPDVRIRELKTEVQRLYGRTAPAGTVRGVAPPVQAAISAAIGGVQAAAARAAEVARPAAASVQAAAPRVLANVSAALPKAVQPQAQAEPEVAPGPPAAAARVAGAQPAAQQPLRARPAPAEEDDEDFDFKRGSQRGHEGHHDHKHYHEYIANISVEKYAVDGSFFVHIFLGDFNPDPATWQLEKNLVGSHAVFVNNAGTACVRCNEDRSHNRIVTGAIPLTGALTEIPQLGGVNGLRPRDVVPYLKQHLHWRIQKATHEEVPRDQVPSLKVSVVHNLVDVPDADDDFPVWSAPDVEREVTRGRPGGAGDDDD